ncbi:hypothetical protein [Fimbriiglobus ruber]|uniref:Uncharacterized protein n=1 Tax=Fimbriiglobus ruber TaxID=1908690 RepID=A0A225DL40_9BACT|nr:hypothetical protein [Fimbriiglobus ruber]OWK42210.1 hypothetical protein FRUB_04288 [Fimbriiglobus ruber]
MEGPSSKWLSFDPTIHAGHLITACSIIVCTLGMWYGMVGDINILKLQNIQREKEIAEVKAEAAATNSAVQGKIDALVQVQRQEVGKLRDDMNGWFMNLDQKLDRKADKR